ncbi:bifunctional diguanylate cyclase/phosphodiesterase [Massilia endophytica]|uniref:bifunctional diguanylate cyclase/phosphodiesterase n=1 Tax=Massilia endophytica TaxID=2899220 RepID=UPI001E61D82E|nr:EAL domain-containing protein [Massilia endophytica]UGQ48010.1 EAL domain-containing protein [Massilia endophytica]
MAFRRKSSPVSYAAALTLGAGLAATAVLFLAVSRLEYAKQSLGFQQRASMRVAAIQRGLDETVEVLTVTNQLFRTVTPVTREQFRVFTRPLLQRYPFIQAFNFHRMLNHGQRLAYEADMQRSIPGFAVRQMTATGQQPAPVSESYNVVDYLEPMQGNEAAFGLDVSPNKAVRAAIERILRTGKPAATALLRLAQDPKRTNSFTMIMPVYQPGAPLDTYEQRHSAWVGDTAAVIRAPHLVHTILQYGGLLDDNRVLVRVYVGDEPNEATAVYTTGQAPASPGGLLSVLPDWLAPDYQDSETQTFQVLGQPWHVRIDALPRPFLADHLGSLSTLLGGILFSVLGAALVHTLVQRSRRVQLLVDARTADLRRSNEKLNADVLMRQRTERALQESEQRFRRLLALSSDWYWEQDAQYRFTHITGGFFEKGHFNKDDYIGQTRWQANPEMLNTKWGREHQALLDARLPFSNLEYSMVGNDGVTRWFQTSGEPVYDSKGEFKGYRGTGSEITERKEAEQRIQHIAHHDVLTGLPNRMLLQDRLSQAIAYANRSGHPLWVMLIDLDRFKFVNDTMGHKAGDLLLKTIASRLQSSVRESDTVARLSGDEFVAILSEYPDETLSPDIVGRVMRALAQPVLLDGKEFAVTCSIGVAVYEADGTPAQHLIEHADIAMYSAKKMGRNCYQFYQPAMNEEAQERLRIEGALRKALERGEFVLHYQPQVDIASGDIVGVEALLRWQHPELGMVPPDRFISLAEETGLIVPIGAWVMQTACAQARAWLDTGLPELRMAVNLSARQFAQPGLVASIEKVLSDTGLPARCLELELTESVFMNDVTQAVGLLHELKALGVALSIDDFGTGYSSFSYLRNFPIDVLKIDRSFVGDIGRDGEEADQAAIVVSIIALAHNLKLRVIAEGVETAAQLAFLRRHACDEMQGYLFSRPLAAADLQAMLEEENAERLRA